MIPVTHNSTAMFLLAFEPDWRTPVRAGFELLAEVETGLTAREARRPYGEQVRVVLEFSLLLWNAEATRLAAGLRSWTTEPVAVPFWPGAVAYADRAASAFQAKVWMAYAPDFSAFDLFEEGDEPLWVGADTIAVPVLLGRIERRDPKWLNPTVCSFDVTFIEQSDSDQALTVASQEWTPGPQPSGAWAGAEPVLLPFQIHHDQPTMTASVEVLRERVGFGRKPVETFYEQDAARSGEASLLETGAAIASLVRFFLDHGAGKPFWAPSWAAAAILTAPIADGSTTFAVQAGHDVQGGDWLMIGNQTVRASAVLETEISIAAEVDSQPQATLVTHLLLVRFIRPRLRVEWVNPLVIRAGLAVRELSAEYTPATDETIGSTIGILPHLVWLYEVREPTKDSAIIHRYTSFERDIEVEGETYKSAKIDHGAIRQGIALDREEVDVRMEIPSDVNHPLVRMATMRTESPLALTIRRAEVILN